MRALVYTAPHQVTLEDHPRAQPAPGECEIAVTAAGICGSDISGFLGHSRRRIPPLVLGHELIGRRVSDGRRVVANPLISCGRCTACLGGAQNLCERWRLLGMDKTAGCYQEFVSVPPNQVYEVPDELSDAQAVVAEPLANIVHLFRIAAPLPFFRMGIVGAGTMGSLALLTALRLGVREVLVQDVSEVRLATARGMGATLAANVSTEEGRAEAKRFAGHGLDLVLDASGIFRAASPAWTTILGWEPDEVVGRFHLALGTRPGGTATAGPAGRTPTATRTATGLAATALGRGGWVGGCHRT